MLGPEPPARCCHSTNGGKKDMLKNLPCSKWRNIHVFSLSRLGRYQTLVIQRMGSSYMKGRVKSSDVVTSAKRQCYWKHLSGVNLLRATKPAHELSFSKSNDWIEIVLDFQINNNIKKYVTIDFNIPVNIDFNLLKSVVQGCLKSRTKYISCT